MLIKEHPMISMVTGKRQLTVPAEVARSLSIDTGTEVEWLEGNRPGEVILKVRPSRSQQLSRLREIGGKYKGKGSDSSMILDREREQSDRDSAGGFGVAENRTKYKAVSRRRKK
jgi:bifunctional DNA-binding transcriptional regulator/antitoxin component of YhaV-PrlF toxin-antitoxin module